MRQSITIVVHWVWGWIGNRRWVALIRVNRFQEAVAPVMPGQATREVARGWLKAV